MTWGLGPLALLPTSKWNNSDSRAKFGSSTWSAGPSGVLLKQTGPWTVGALAGHVWDISGDADVSLTNFQPFVAYATPDAWSFVFETETLHNHKADSGNKWSVPLEFQVEKVVTLGQQPIQFTGGVIYWADSPDGGAEDFGFRLGMKFLFPKG